MTKAAVVVVLLQLAACGGLLTQLAYRYPTARSIVFLCLTVRYAWQTLIAR